MSAWTAVRAHQGESPLPEYLPARMVNEFVYCPWLFFYEWVEGVFRESADTVAGKFEHGRVDSGTGALPGSGEVAEGGELKTRGWSRQTAPGPPGSIPEALWLLAKVPQVHCVIQGVCSPVIHQQ